MPVYSRQTAQLARTLKTPHGTASHVVDTAYWIALTLILPTTGIEKHKQYQQYYSSNSDDSTTIDSCSSMKSDCVNGQQLCSEYF
jgi:hypothetical protein